jgi:hypothetical protein
MHSNSINWRADKTDKRGIPCLTLYQLEPKVITIAFVTSIDSLASLYRLLNTCQLDIPRVDMIN